MIELGTFEWKSFIMFVILAAILISGFHGFTSNGNGKPKEKAVKSTVSVKPKKEEVKVEAPVEKKEESTSASDESNPFDPDSF